MHRQPSEELGKRGSLSTIEELKADVQRLAAELTEAEGKLLTAQVARCQLRVGDTVKDRAGKEFRITKIRPFCGSFWLEGNPRNKDGDFSKSVRNIYGWEGK